MRLIIKNNKIIKNKNIQVNLWGKEKVSHSTKEKRNILQKSVAK